MTLTWYGDEIAAQVERATGSALGETVDLAVGDAQGNTPVLTGAARDSLRATGTGLRRTWGYHVAYGLWIEIGARGKAGVHAMRRAADNHYPGLVGRIRAALPW